MTVNQWQPSSRFPVTYLTLCLVVSIWVVVIPTSHCQNALPSQHGLMYEKNSGEASGAMMAFFDQQVAKPEVAKPEAQNVADPIGKQPAAIAADPGGGSANVGHRSRTSASVIAGSAVAASLIVLGVAAAAYMVHARHKNGQRAAGSSQSLEEVRLGAAV